MSPEKDKTKEKIIDAANKLFAEKGFSGASVRDIAQLAEVNTAAINYHFKSKENLYWNVFDYNYETLDQGVQKIGENTDNTADFAVEVFRFFLSDKAALMNTFKIFLSDNITIPNEETMLQEDKKFGPPGEKAFLEKINNDLEGKASVEGQKWMTKMIFSLLVHFGVMMNTKVMQIKCQDNESLQPEGLEKSFRHSIQAHLDYLKKNSNIFS